MYSVYLMSTFYFTFFDLFLIFFKFFELFHCAADEDLDPPSGLFTLFSRQTYRLKTSIITESALSDGQLNRTRESDERITSRNQVPFNIDFVTK